MLRALCFEVLFMYKLVDYLTQVDTQLFLLCPIVTLAESFSEFFSLESGKLPNI